MNIDTPQREKRTPELARFISLVEKSTKEFRKSAKVAQLKSFWIRSLIVIFGAGSTVLLGLRIGDPKSQAVYELWSRNSALVMTAAVSVLAFLSGFWNLDMYWLQLRKKRAQLERLRLELSAQEVGVVTQLDIESLWLRYLDIIDTSPIWDDAVERQSRKKLQCESAAAEDNSPVTGP